MSEVFDNNELIEVILNGENQIGLDTISSFLGIVSQVVYEASPNEDVDTKVLPFEKGSFKVILDIINNPLVKDLVFPVLSGYFVAKLVAGTKKGDFKVIKRNDDTGNFDILHDDGTKQENIPRPVIKLLKNPNLNKQAKVFVKNYMEENREELELLEKNSNEKLVIPKKKLKFFGISKKVDTVEQVESSVRVWVEVKSWGYETGIWKLKPLNVIQEINSQASFDCTIRNLDSLKEFIIEDSVHKAYKYIEIELGIEYAIDIVDKKIMSNIKFYIDKIYNTSKKAT